MNMIQSALESNDEYYNHQVERREYADILQKNDVPAEGTMLPAIEEACKPESAGQRTVDRYIR